ncbi:hypothetical protein UFOVP453_42 [uncultured Caudovirales phage]|uniref:Uncharacterized protein n=1 Tax=uncultured Caudovirales phage TaxID=2100421 RepID=A0A6J5MH61_9CAUD|nr:hypothetical protein UFOVP453_42 [uncultured Caudovirales phage]
MNARIEKRAHANGVDVYKLATERDALKFAKMCDALKVSHIVRGRFVHVYA